MLVMYVKDNYYAGFHDPSYHWYRERHFSILINVKLYQCLWSMKYRSRVLGHGACLQSMSRTITMQGFMILAIIGTKKDTSVFYST